MTWSCSRLYYLEAQGMYVIIGQINFMILYLYFYNIVNKWFSFDKR